jgi:hypothetical protein
MNELITIVTPTIGNSTGRLGILCADLKRYTNIPFSHIICDDGTHNVEEQIKLADHHNALFIQNAGPTWGISYNLNYALDHVNTPWCFLIEDGVRPSVGWLETALDWIDKIGSKTWRGFPVGMGGCSSLQDWHLAMADVWPGISVGDVFNHRIDRHYFYDFSPGWNDGYWCWKRLIPRIIDNIERGFDKDWERDVLLTKQVIMNDMESLKKLHPQDVKQAVQKWAGRDSWPANRTSFEARYPGPFLIINMKAWRDVGKFRDGCTFFEGHLGIRMQMHGYLSLGLESPPFFHYPSQGFSECNLASGPRHHEDTDDLFRRDFGYDHMDAPNKPEIINRFITEQNRRDINKDLRSVPVHMEAGWEKWL